MLPVPLSVLSGLCTVERGEFGGHDGEFGAGLLRSAQTIDHPLTRTSR
ncbi:hypothetical protein [Streptomyces sp. NPDC050164]